MESGDTSDEETHPCDPPKRMDLTQKELVIKGNFHVCCHGNQKMAQEEVPSWSYQKNLAWHMCRANCVHVSVGHN